MSAQHWFRNLFPRASRKSAKKGARRAGLTPPARDRARLPLYLERLEDRLAPAVTVSFAGGTLAAAFGAASDTATITATGAGSFNYSGTGSAGGSQAGVTAITVTDPSATLTQTLT